MNEEFIKFVVTWGIVLFIFIVGVLVGRGGGFFLF